MVVTNYGNNRVQAFNTEGKFPGTWGSFGKEQGNFVALNAMAWDSAGKVYVSSSAGGQAAAGRLQIFNVNVIGDSEKRATKTAHFGKEGSPP